MPDDASSPPADNSADKGQPAATGAPDTELNARLDRIEQLLEQNDALRTRTRLVNWLGVILVLSVLGLFFLRLKSYAEDEYLRPLRENPAMFAKEIATDLELEDVLRREADAAQKELTERVIPDFQRRVYDEFVARLPEIEQELVDMGGRLDDYTQKAIRDHLEKVLTETMDEAFAEVHKEFPELTEAAWEEQLAKAQEHFIEELIPVIEERYAKVHAALEDLSETVKTVGMGEGGDAYGEMMDGRYQAKMDRQLVEHKLLDALLEVLIYELKPEWGDQVAQVNGDEAPRLGGDK